AIWLDKGLVKQRGEPKDVCEQYLQAYYESQQTDQEAATGGNRSAAQQVNIESLLAKHAAIEKPAHIDQRLPFLNASNLRNDLRLFEFKPDAPSFGQGGSRVISVALCNAQGQPMSWAVGGEDVELLIEAIALQKLHSPIVGFVVKDRLGQTLFGDNTFVAYEHNCCVCETGQLLRTRFQFQMPRLPVGDYSITIAIADGTQEEHIQHQWIFDAVTFRSESTSISAGLIGIPMQNIFMDVR
ncbi:MAG: Wzt carbohydrate-binding domain-containing protein, partial [Methylophilaceae bacterium]|nr:Wzt carbohydrate-binding domain-containing protein [Methylophilaceae bacterium]